jgi:hypothetical protein
MPICVHSRLGDDSCLSTGNRSPRNNSSLTIPASWTRVAIAFPPTNINNSGTVPAPINQSTGNFGADVTGLALKLEDELERELEGELGNFLANIGQFSFG